MRRGHETPLRIRSKPQGGMSGDAAAAGTKWYLISWENKMEYPVQWKAFFHLNYFHSSELFHVTAYFHFSLFVLESCWFYDWNVFRKQGMACWKVTQTGKSTTETIRRSRLPASRSRGSISWWCFQTLPCFIDMRTGHKTQVGRDIRKES